MWATQKALAAGVDAAQVRSDLVEIQRDGRDGREAVYAEDKALEAMASRR